MKKKGMLSLFSVAVLLACGCGGPPETTTTTNIVFIVVDTLRADHVGSYGARRDTTPALDELAADAVRFDRAYATAPWTLPSVVSMLTGQYPSRHTAVALDRRLPDNVDTLAEILNAAGFATASVISHTVIGTSHNVQQGFEENVEPEDQHHDFVSTRYVTQTAVRMLEGFSASPQPFFLFVHFFDPHYEYKRHTEVGFAPPSAGRLRGTEPLRELRRMQESLTSEELELLRSLYDEEIRITDTGIGRVLSRLRELGLWEQTIVVVTADHGEGFMEHGNLGHTRTLYEELVHVPLIIRSPGEGRRGVVVEDPVSLVNLTPTVLDLLGIDLAAWDFEGDSLAPYLSGSTSEFEGNVYIEVDFVSPKKTGRAMEVHKRATIAGHLKLIRDETTGQIELYDLSEDAFEAKDIHEEHPELAAHLLGELENAIASSRAKAVASQGLRLSEEEIENLLALGYGGD